MSVLILAQENPDLQSLIRHIENQVGQAVLRFSELEGLENYCKESGDEVLAILASLKALPSSGSVLPKIPKVIFTEGHPVEGSNLLRFENVLDFVLNPHPHNHAYVLNLLRRVASQGKVNMLVAHADSFHRTLLRNVLVKQGYVVHLAGNLTQAREMMHSHPSIRLVMCAMDLPGGPAGALILHLRERYSKQDLAIIGLADSHAEGESVRILRMGASDVLGMPPPLAEIQVRVAQNLALVEAFQEITELSRKDFLTGLNNRRHFHETASKLFAQMKRGKIKLACAMFDIDNFKKVNDSLGHAAGDVAIVECARLLRVNLRETDVIARFGGEEFCVLLAGHEQVDHAVLVMERLVTQIAKQQLVFEGLTFSVTVSCGLTIHPGESLETMVQEADRLLYLAKTTGKNKVVSNSSSQPQG